MVGTADIKKSLAIIVPSHMGHKFWLKGCLESCRKLGYPIYLVYDNPFWKTRDLWRAFPPNATMAMADVVLIRHRVFSTGVGVCHFWNMIYGLTVLKEAGFKYAFNINGDCVLEKPEGFEAIIEMLGDKDLFPCQWYEKSQRYCGTMGWLGKVDLMLDFFYTYCKEAHMYSRTTEGRLWHYINDNNVSVAAPVNCENNFKLPAPGTWFDLLGFRHIHAEHKVRRWKKMEPVEEKYYDFLPPNDIFKDKGEYRLLNKYWQSRSQEDLEAWWNA